MKSPENFKHGCQGIFLELPADDYFAAPGLSRSMMEHLNPPIRLNAYLLRPELREPWAVMGRAIHQRLLEPNKPLPFITKPEKYTNEEGESKPWSGNAKVCKKWVADQESAGLFVLGPKEVESVNGAVDSMLNNSDPEMKDLIAENFTKGYAEVSCFRKVTVGDVSFLIKARLDWLANGVNFISDIKSIQADGTRTDNLPKIVEQYALQAVHYTTVFNSLAMDDRREDFVLWLAEKVAPFVVRPIRIRSDSNAMRIARNEWTKWLNVYAECIRSGKFPGWPATIMEVDLPTWAVSKADNAAS